MNSKNILRRGRTFDMAISSSSFSVKDVGKFHAICSEAYLFFENDIGVYIEELRQHGNALAMFIQNDVPECEAVLAHSAERLELQQWFTTQQSAVVGIFNKYLKVNDLGK